jgi:hypothetical protein
MTASELIFVAQMEIHQEEIVSVYSQFRRQTGEKPDTLLVPCDFKPITLKDFMGMDVMYCDTDRIVCFKAKK